MQVVAKRGCALRSLCCRVSGQPDMKLGRNLQGAKRRAEAVQDAVARQKIARSVRLRLVVDGARPAAARAVGVCFAPELLAANPILGASIGDFEGFLTGVAVLGLKLS